MLIESKRRAERDGCRPAQTDTIETITPHSRRRARDRRGRKPGPAHRRRAPGRGVTAAIRGAVPRHLRGGRRRRGDLGSTRQLPRGQPGPVRTARLHPRAAPGHAGRSSQLARVRGHDTGTRRGDHARRQRSRHRGHSRSTRRYRDTDRGRVASHRVPRPTGDPHGLPRHHRAQTGRGDRAGFGGAPPDRDGSDA